ncbi:hypothetical protein ACQUZK_09475, partial [Streptococcus pyogenes]|uniref:hypothetical protein n=1 Tax=Streptococcus pyogenes TaxID=1314 RepID=UPI003DA0246D
ARGGHGFTDPEATRRMHREFATSGVAPRHVVDGPSPEAVADAVLARRASGQLRLDAADV